MSIRHVTALALCAACGAALAQNTDLDAQARQQRIDSAYEHYQHHATSTGEYTGTKASHHGMKHHESATGKHATVGESLSSYGHSFVADVKKAPHQMAEAARETGHSIADAAREQGHDAKAAAHEAKKSVSGS